MTSRRRRPIKREQGKLRDARLFLIVSEGSDPEQSYFELFDTSPRRQFLFIGPKKDRSAPRTLEGGYEKRRRNWTGNQATYVRSFWIRTDGQIRH